MESSDSKQDGFDRLLGSMHGLPDVTSTKPTTARTITPLLGTSEMFIIQTYRQKEIGDTIFLEAVSKNGTVRLALPPQVADAIARQRDALTGKSRSRAAKENMKVRMERGEVPGFMKKKRK
jgi:hypothetical protein